MDYSALEDIGLTASETRVYIALIELGSSTVGPITKKAKVASSKTGELLQKLLDKGLTTTYSEKKTTYYKAVSPHRILDYIKDKKKELENKEKQVKNILPTLDSIYKENITDTSVELFRGYKGAETVFKDMIRSLSKGDEFMVIGGGDVPSTNKRTKWFFERIHRQRSKKGIILKIIFSEARRKSLKEMALFPFTKAKYLSFGTPSTVNIYKDVTILLSMSPTPAAIRIKNKQITQSYKIYFEQMWKLAKK